MATTQGQGGAASETGDAPLTALPEFAAGQFALVDPPECDMVMKGGVTSGIVYPYAILQIATKYQLRSLGGTSAGAIAAAFAAAAEYGRQHGRPEAFLVLKEYCDNLPARLLSLFQPTPNLEPAVDCGKVALVAGGIRPIFRQGLLSAVVPALLGATVLGLPSGLLQPSAYATALAAVLGGLIGGGYGLYSWGRKTFADPLLGAVRDLPAHNFGFCTGLTQPGHDPLTDPGLTDWIYQVLQHIAFGDPDHPEPLTFGHLKGPDPDKRLIDLKVVTTNLSMRRPHTLPRLGVTAGFRPEEWDRLFPRAVMDWLYGGRTSKWQVHSGSWQFPAEDKLPIVIAVRMSLSFPLLFTAIPLVIEDTELPDIVAALGGRPYKRFRTAHFSDGGISSNFPIHMFDAWLPTRPTFAFSLEDLLWDADEVTRRVTLPQSSSDGMGVQIKQLKSIIDFAWQILNSAKDWQDQLLSELSGQRERIARIFLTGKEGGLNLDMKPEVSRQLMLWGYEAGCKFTDGEFDFDEHRWRRLLVIFKNLEENLGTLDRMWSGGYEDWFKSYMREIRSYGAVTLTERRQIGAMIRSLVDARRAAAGAKPVNLAHLPRRTGVLKVAPKY